MPTGPGVRKPAQIEKALSSFVPPPVLVKWIMPRQLDRKNKVLYQTKPTLRHYADACRTGISPTDGLFPNIPLLFPKTINTPLSYQLCALEPPSSPPLAATCSAPRPNTRFSLTFPHFLSLKPLLSPHFLAEISLWPRRNGRLLIIYDPSRKLTNRKGCSLVVVYWEFVVWVGSWFGDGCSGIAVSGGRCGADAHEIGGFC